MTEAPPSSELSESVVMSMVDGDFDAELLNDGGEERVNSTLSDVEAGNECRPVGEGEDIGEEQRSMVLMLSLSVSWHRARSIASLKLAEYPSSSEEAEECQQGLVGR